MSGTTPTRPVQPNATPPIPHNQHHQDGGSLMDWLLHHPYRMGQFRRMIINIVLLVLSIGGAWLVGTQRPSIAVAYGPNNCTYQAEEVNPPTLGQTAATGSVVAITWHVRNSGTCTDWSGVGLAQRSGNLPSDQPLVQIETGEGGRVSDLRIPTASKAPAAPGLYETNWQLQTANGKPFGPIMTRRVQVYPAGQPSPNFPFNQNPIDPGAILRLVGALLLYPLPAWLALQTVLAFGAKFLQSVYHLKTPPQQHVNGIMYGRSVGEVTAAGNKLNYNATNPAIEMIGGPMRVTVADRTAIVTEIGGRFGRVLGAGVYPLRPHERIRAVIDLQIQQKKVREKALTKDGIPLELDIEMAFRVTEQDIPGEAPPDPPPPIGLTARLLRLIGRPVSPTLLAAATKHRFSREAVRRIVYETSIFSADAAPDWAQAFASVRAGDITEQFSELRLDDLSSPEDPDVHPLAAIVQKGLANGRQAASAMGIDILNMSIGIVEPSADIKENVNEQRLGNWMIEWKRRAKILEAEAEAEELQAMEEARAEAQADMIESLLASFRVATDGRSQASADVIAMRFVDALETLMHTQASASTSEEESGEQPDQTAKTVLIARTARKE